VVRFESIKLVVLCFILKLHIVVYGQAEETEGGERQKNFVVIMIIMDTILSSSVVQICDDCRPGTEVVKYRRTDVSLYNTLVAICITFCNIQKPLILKPLTWKIW
jgi:hypothetical protein